MERKGITAAGAALLLMLLLLAACASEPGASPELTVGPTQTNEGGQVTVKVTWRGAAAGPVFDVVLDTHAVDLDGYDLTRLAVLRTSDGREVRPTTWSAGPGGHHRAGALVFSANGADGRPVLTSGAGGFEIVIRDVAGVTERSFRWAQ